MPVTPPILPAPPVISNTRTANSLLIEISGHLVEDIVNTTLTLSAAGPAYPPAPATATLLSPASLLAIYQGAQIVLAQPDGTLPTIITILSVDLIALTCTTILPAGSLYPAGSTLLAGTFPTQATTDPLFTQQEVLSYLARAQNEFLLRVPCVYQFTGQTLDLGEDYQALPANAIELTRVSINGSRLYEVTQSELSMTDPQWLFNSTQPLPQAWFEDRTGYYGWGVAPSPQTQIAASLVTSQRGPEVLNLLSLFLVPDPMIHIIRMKAMQWIYEKSGEQQSPSMARIYSSRFDSGVAIAGRFLSGMLGQQGGG